MSGLLPVELVEAQIHVQLDEWSFDSGSSSYCHCVQWPSRFKMHGVYVYSSNRQHMKMITVVVQ